jgi:hypothetical protein
MPYGVPNSKINDAMSVIGQTCEEIFEPDEE